MFSVLGTKRTTTTGSVTSPPCKFISKDLFHWLHLFLFFFLACLTPVVIISAADVYLSSMTINGAYYSAAPLPTSFQMTKSTMTVELDFGNLVR